MMIKPVCDFPTKGLIGLWRMGDASGSLTDKANGHDSVSQTGLTYGATGLFGDAITFNGTTGRANLGKPAELEVNTFAISCWVKLNALSTSHGLLTKYASNSGDRIIHFAVISTNDNPRLICYNTSGGGTTVISPDALTTGTWYHIWGENQQGASGMKLYVDNVLKDSAAGVTALDFPGNSDWLIGAIEKGTTSPDAFMNGTIGQIAMWNRIPSDDERAAVYNSGNGVQVYY